MAKTASKSTTTQTGSNGLSFDDFKQEVLKDYRLGWESRHASLLGRKEVLTGKAKFGIFGDGKEVAQLAMAKVFRKGDFRAGYYRDQTFMFAAGMSTIAEFFAQLYAHPDVEAEPCSAGRMMNGHYGTRLLDENGDWLSQTDKKNSAADTSPTAGQMLRLLGLAHASKMYRQNKALHAMKDFSNKGNEIAFGTIGNASCAEGFFFEALNAAGVLQVPLLMSVWDDGYGISVPNKYQIAKDNISEILSGLQRTKDSPGFEIIRVRGWDYPGLCAAYLKAEKICREEHVPVLLHVQEVTQPQGHSTSGSHERYKSPERLAWEEEFDGLRQMRLWMIKQKLATDAELDSIEEEAKKSVKAIQKEAWNKFTEPIKTDLNKAVQVLEELGNELEQNGHAELGTKAREAATQLKSAMDPLRRDILSALRAMLRHCRGVSGPGIEGLRAMVEEMLGENRERYSSHLYSRSAQNALNVEPEWPAYAEEPEQVDGREILQAYFDQAFEKDPRLVAFGEDLGKIGDVNQGFAGLQEKYGETRIFDTGIREATIIGQGMGMAMRGLRPIAEIQYLDYLMYGLEPLYDDVSTLQYRTRGGQKCPLIVRTRGHRLEGIWHSGSPMGMILNAIRGMYVLVPRDMTRAAGFYNTLLKSDEPGLVIEVLNGYRSKEAFPQNLGSMCIPLGVPEVLESGQDVTLVTYGACVRIAQEACRDLKEMGISVELIDVQSLIPFDLHHSIVESVKKTGRIVFLDEDVPGGASAYMMQKVLEEQKGYFYLDSEPRTLTGKEHRPAYGSDGDYFSKPSKDDIIDAVYGLMNEARPQDFPAW